MRRTLTKATQVKARVICIGNLVAGGAGKTPVVRAIGEWAKTQNLKACFLSKGYGGKLSGIWVDPVHHRAADVGDEPLLLACILPTLVSRCRLSGARRAEKEGYTHIIMDDGFQNPTLHKDVSFLVIDTGFGLGNGRCIPAGPLRETPESGFARADAVLLTARAGATPQPIAVPSSIPQFPTALVSEFSEPIAGKKLVAFTGIGRPEGFFDSLSIAGATLTHRAAFADHHLFSDGELNELSGIAGKENARLITTAKDAVRLAPAWRNQVIIADLSAKWLDAGVLFAMLK